MLVASGAAAVAYEVLWARDWALLYGSTAVGTAVVLAVYFAGLAAGAAVATVLGARRRPLTLYAGLEAALAVAALAYLAVRPWLPAASIWLAHTLPGGGLSIARVLLAFLVLGVPTALIGASLPAVAAALPPSAMQTVGRLYAWNTLGGALGALACGFVAVRALGVRGSFLAAAALDAVVAAVAFRLAHRPIDVDPPAAGEPIATVIRPRSALAVAAVTGYLGLAGEVVWTRGLAGVLSNSVYSVAIVLGAMLLGLVVGARAGATLASPLAPTRQRLVTVLLCLAAATAASIAAIAALPSTTVFLARLLGVRSAAGGVLVEAMLALLVVLVPGACLGAALPLTLVLAGGPAPGRTAGRVLAVNTAAGIAGALSGAFLLLPTAGLARSLLLLATIAAGTAAAIATRGRQRLAAAILIAAFAAAAWRPVMPLAAREQRDGERIVFHRDGAAATVSVTADASDRKRLRINGQYSLGGTAGVLLERRAAHLAVLLHPRPSRLLALGIATGDTIGAAAMHPDLRIDGVELVPEVLAAAALFGRENDHVLANPRVRLVVDDARSYLLTTDERYDVILSDLFLPWTAGTASLYSLDFYRLGAAHLRAGGLYCQWLPLHQLGVRDLEMIVATFVAAFPDAHLWVAYHRTLTPLAALVGSTTPMALNSAALNARLADGPAGRALSGNGLDAVGDLAALYVTDGARLRAATGGVPLITDDRPRLEFTAPAAYFHQEGLAKATLAWIRGLEPAVPPVDAPQVATPRVRALLLRAQLALLDGDGPSELQAYLETFSLAPSLRTIRAALAGIAHERLAVGDRKTAEFVARELVRYVPDAPETAALTRALASR